MTLVQQDKETIRKKIRALHTSSFHQDKDEAALYVYKRIEQLPFFDQIKHILLFASLPDEITTYIFLERWSCLKTLYLPRIQGDNIEVVPYNPQQLTKGMYGIIEPTGEALTTLQQLDCVIAPGVAFDKQGNRLGRGKGYYDRLLSQLNTTNIGICYSYQLLDSLPTEAHDLRMHYIITPDTVIKTT